MNGKYAREGCGGPPVTGETHTKITGYQSIRMAPLAEPGHTGVSQIVEGPHLAGGNVNDSVGNVSFLKQLNMSLPRDRSHSPSKHLPMRKGNVCPCQDVRMNVNTALFLIVENWKQPKGPSTVNG